MLWSFGHWIVVIYLVLFVSFRPEFNTSVTFGVARLVIASKSSGPAKISQNEKL